MWVLSLLFGLVVVLAITAATGYFVAQEFAYMAVDRSRLKARAAEGDDAAARALSVTRRTSFMLSGAQLGITVTALLVGFVAEPLIGQALGDVLGDVGVPTGVGIAVGTVAALLFSTFVQMLFGELFPKNLAIARPERVAISLARSTTVYLTVFGWLIKVFDHAANLLLKAVGVEPVHDVEHAATRQDLEHIVAGSRKSGGLPPELSLLLDRILAFPDEDVEHAMIPRARVDVVRDDEPVSRLWVRMSDGHSRYPVVDADEEVVGVVQLHDVLAGNYPDSATAGSLMRPPVLVPTTMLLPDALALLNREKAQIACVLDEYGGLAGVLTIEDIGEELVGEITDEHDPDQPVVTPLEAASDTSGWEMPGEMPLDEVSRSIGRQLPVSDSETLGGLVTEQHGALPDEGTVVMVELPLDPAILADADDPTQELLRLEVVQIERHVPRAVRVTLVSDDPQEEE